MKSYCEVSLQGWIYCPRSFPLGWKDTSPDQPSLPLTSWPTLCRSICWNWHNIPPRLEAMRSRKQAHSGGKQERRKPVPSKTGSRAASSWRTLGPKTPICPGARIIFQALWALLPLYLEKPVPRTEVVLATFGWCHFSLCPSI